MISGPGKLRIVRPSTVPPSWLTTASRPSSARTVASVTIREPSLVHRLCDATTWPSIVMGGARRAPVASAMTGRLIPTQIQHRPIKYRSARMVTPSYVHWDRDGQVRELAYQRFPSEVV